VGSSPPQRRSSARSASGCGSSTGGGSTRERGIDTRDGGWRESQGSTIPLAQGDIVKVTGAPIGCIVRRQDGYLALDCRRIGPLAGSYGAILTSRKVLVVRFESQRTAKVVFSARHNKLGVHTCG
jgi:hypothetical protein